MSDRTRPALLALVAALVTGPLAAQQFEGVVAFKVLSKKGKTTEMTMSIKGTNVRMESSSGGRAMVMLMDAEAQVMRMVMAEEKMYMTMDLKSARSHAQNSDTPPKITALGTTETIAGRSCANFLMETEKSKSEVCNGTGLGYFMSARGGPMGGESDLPDLDVEAYRAHFTGGFFPLRYTTIKGDKRTVKMEATRVEPKSLDTALFQVPEGFTEMKMPMGMMPN